MLCSCLRLIALYVIVLYMLLLVLRAMVSFSVDFDFCGRVG